MKKYLVFSLALLMLGRFSTAETGPTRLKIPWDDLKKILGVKPDQVRLSWDEFTALASRTASQNFPTHINSNGDVILSQEHFKQLIQQLIPPSSVKMPYTFMRGRSDAVLDKRSIIVNSVLHVYLNNVQRKWIDIEIPLSETAFRSAFVNDRAALVSFKDGRMIISTQNQGEQVIRLTYSVPRPAMKDAQSAVFPIVRTPLTSISAKIPERNIDVRVDQALHSETQPQDGSTLVKAILPPTAMVRMSWTPVVPEAAKGEAKLYIQTDYHLSIEDDLMRVHCYVDFQAIQNSVKSITLQLPTDYSVVAVQGQYIGEWSVQGEDNPILTVPFQIAQKGSSSIEVTLEKIFSDRKITLGFPGVAVVGAVRERGHVGVELRGAAQVILSESTTGVERVDVQQLPQQLSTTSRRPMLYGFQYLRRPFQLFLSVERHDNVALLNTVVDNVEGRTWITKDGKIINQVLLSVRNSSKQLLEFGLPEGASLWSVFVDQQPTKPSMNESKRLLIPLNRSSGSRSFPVEVIYFEEQPGLALSGKIGLQFPTVDLMVTDWAWNVVLPKDYRTRSIGNEVELVSHRATNEIQVGSGFGIADSPSLPEGSTVSVEDQSKKLVDKVEVDPLVGKDDGRIRSNVPKAPGQRRSRDGKVISKEKPADVGVLPIRVKVPISGQTWRFSKSMVPAHSPLSVGFLFLSAGLVTWGMLLIFGLSVFAGFYFVKRFYGVPFGGHHDRP